MDHLGVTWMGEGEVSKLLGIPFGLALTSKDVDEFLQERIDKKLEYLSTKKVNIMEIGVIVSSVLLSSTLFFASIWGDSKAGINKVWSKIQGYMWSSALHRARSKVSWL